MKKQISTPGKLQLVKCTVARLNAPSRSAGRENPIDDNTTASSLMCRTFML